jgi:thiamine-phosphate pyrophosphorylase
MKVIVISPTRKKDNEVENVIRMLENGLETFHLRKPKYSTRMMREYIEKIPSQFHNKIVIHSHHRLAAKYNLKGIHLTRSHLSKKYKTWFNLKYIQLRRGKIEISVSQSKLSTLYEKDRFQSDYCFLSPIFDSMTGKFQSGFYEDGIRAAIQKTGRKVIARGGIDITRLEKINEMGFYGCAFFSTIWDSDTPVEDYISIIHRLHELKIAIE